MDTDATVRCVRPYDLPTRFFTDDLDQFRNALYLPPEAFDDLGIDPYDYVDVRTEGSRGTERVVSAKLRSDPELVDGEAYVGALRTNLLNRLVELDSRQISELDVTVEPASDISQFTGRAERTYDDEIEYRVCHLSDERMGDLDVEPGDELELYNPITGGRIDVTAGFPHRDSGMVRVDVRSRQALDVFPGDDVGVRNIQASEEHRGGFKRTVLKTMIDSREMPFNVKLGPDQDEYRSIVRMTEDMMDFLGIDPGDDVVLKWRGQRTKSQCLPTELDEDDPPNTIKAPSTERDQVDVSVHDAVVVERDMWYVFRQQMAVSVLGIFGVLVGVLQALSLLDIQRLVREYGIGPVVFGVLLLISSISVLVIWLLLTPARQDCVTHD